MKLLRFLEGISEVIRAVFMVIIDNEARIKAIHTRTNKVPVMGFREGAAWFVTSELDALWIIQNNHEYTLNAILYSSAKGRRMYSVYSSRNRADVVRCRELLGEQMPNAKVL